MGCANTNWSLPVDPVRKSLSDQAKIGEPCEKASRLSPSVKVVVVPSARTTASVTVSSIAPANEAGVVTVSDVTSAVCIVQEPSALCVPPFTVQSDGRSLIVTVTVWSTRDGSAKPRFIGSPAMPAGASFFVAAKYVPALKALEPPTAEIVVRVPCVDPSLPSHALKVIVSIGALAAPLKRTLSLADSSKACPLDSVIACHSVLPDSWYSHVPLALSTEVIAMPK